MDRYKFRAKRLDNGEWVEGYYVQQNLANKHFIVTETECINPYTTSYLNLIEVDPATVGQYTGLNLKDEQCTELYRGDIIEFVVHDYYSSGNEIRRGYIEWWADAGAFVVAYADEKYEHDWLYMILINDDEAKKIGTIHDNPELLEG